MRTFRVAASPDDARPRLDHFLAGCDLSLTRSQLQRIIATGDVTIDGAVVIKPGQRLHGGERVDVRLRPPSPIEAQAEDLPLAVLYEDEHIIVVDKAAGMVVHPAPGHAAGTLVNALLHRCAALSGVGGALRPGIVHRLDKDTSGVMVATKSDAAHGALAAAFAAHDLDREYVAVVAPAPAAARGTIATLHGRHPTDRKRFSSRVTRGKRAITHYTVDARYGGGAALVRCRLETGRTHQIRVHLADAGSPVIGDPLYGRRTRGPLEDAAAALGRQALHAALLGFAHPVTGAPLSFATEPPADMQRLLTALAALPVDGHQSRSRSRPR